MGNDARERAVALVHAFGRAWERCDIDGILSMLSPGIVYQNVPLPALRGHDEVRAFITPNLTAAERTEWVFLAAEADADGRRVLTERVDSFIFDNGVVAVPLMGIFEIDDGLIVRWRDYADLASFMRDMAAIGRAPGPGVAA